MPQILAAPDQAILLVAAVTFLLFAGLVLALLPAPERPIARLTPYLTAMSASPGALVESQSIGQRLIGPFFGSLIGLLGRLSPARVRTNAASQLRMAGSRMSPATYLALAGFCQIALPLAAMAHLGSVRRPTATDWGLLVVAFVLGQRLPGILLKRKIKARQQAIDRSLPYTLDMLIACVEGGLSLDASLAKIVEQSDGPLADEIRLTQQEIALGRPAMDAMRELGERTGASDLRRFCNGIVQAERMGIAIADAMRTLASESRVRRRQRAEETARKAPIKMVPVLIFLVLPGLLIVVMGPAVLMLMKIFSGQKL